MHFPDMPVVTRTGRLVRHSTRHTPACDPGTSLAVALKTSGLNLPEYVHELVKAGKKPENWEHPFSQLPSKWKMTPVSDGKLVTPPHYPIDCSIASGLLAALVVFVFVVPKFANILTNPKADIPAFSGGCCRQRLWLVNNKIMAGICAAAAIAGGWITLSKQAVREQIWEAAATLPVVGRWIDHVGVACRCGPHVFCHCSSICATA